MTTCLDCGEPMTPRLDSIPLCDPCLELAVLLAGSGEARMEQLADGHALVLMDGGA